MNISWVIANGYQVDATIDINVMKNIGPIWGSWRTWRACGTDNVICQDYTTACDLVKRNFQKDCNFYIHESHYSNLGRPADVKLYAGEYGDDVTDIEDIISMHLASSTSNVILMLGFNLPKIQHIADRYELHKIKNYYGLIQSLITTNSDTQWVLVDHPTDLSKNFQDLPNLTCDTLGNVLQLLAQ